MENYLTPEDIVESLKVKKTTVWTWLRTGKLKGTKTGKIWRIKESDMNDFLKQTGFRQENELERDARLDKLKAKLEAHTGEKVVKEGIVQDGGTGLMEKFFTMESGRKFITYENRIFEIGEEIR